MQTERVTILMTPGSKARVASRAKAQGISMGEYLRRKVDAEDDELTPEQEAELAALVKQVNVAVPQMNTMIDEMQETLRRTHGEVDAMLRQMGVRK